MLRVEKLDAGYGRMTVLRDITLEIPEGELTLLLGPNGAGKTTLLRAISGLLPLQAGSVDVDGQSMGGWSPERAARHGVRHVMEGHRIFPEMSVEDNIRLGQAGVPRRGRRSEREIFDEAYDVFPVLGEKHRLDARNLSGGQQQMLALVQAWVARPKYMLCDEPSLGLALALVPEILAFLKRRTSEGMGVLLVEQLVEQPLRFADRVAVLRQGELKFSDVIANVDGPQHVAALMLGDALAH